MSQTATKSHVKVTTAFALIRNFPASRSQFKPVDVNRGIMQTETEDIVQFAADNKLTIHGDFLTSGETIVGQLEILD